MNPEPEPFEGGLFETHREPFSGPSPKVDRLVDGVRSLEQWYAVDFERRVAGLTEMLRSQIAQELRAQFQSELNAQVERLRREYDERLSGRERAWEQERECLQSEIDELRRKVPSQDVMNEISAAEAVVEGSLDTELERLIPNAVALARLLQERVEDLEAKAYLRGLKFAVPECS